MTVQLTINVPDETYQLAQTVAEMNDTTVENIVSNLLYSALPLIPSIDPTRSVSELTDDEVMALSHITLTAGADQRQLALLHKQQDITLSPSEQKELGWFTQVEGIATLYKAKAMVEAVRRGLIDP